MERVLGKAVCFHFGLHLNIPQNVFFVDDVDPIVYVCIAIYCLPLVICDCVLQYFDMYIWIGKMMQVFLFLLLCEWIIYLHE
jgi:hypothetical protein